MFLLVIVGPVYCIFQLQMEFAQENVFCTEIYSDTQLMQKYRDISLKGGFLPHATLMRNSGLNCVINNERNGERHKELKGNE